MNCSFPLTYCLLFAILFVSACSVTAEKDLPEEVKELENVTVHETNPTPASSITLTETTPFEDSEEISFGQLTAVDVDNSGNVYIVEGSNGNEGIYVFDREGTFKNKIGRAGRGPGEFQALFDIDVFGNRIFTLDGTLLRIQVFSTETHDLVHEANLEPGQWDHSGGRTMTFPDKFHVLNDSAILGVFNHLNFDMDTRSYYRMDYNGNVTSERLLIHDFIKHLETADGSRTFYDEFGGRGLMAVSADNQIYTTWSEEMLFKVYDSDGTYKRSFYHPFQNSELARSEALNYHDNELFQNALKNEGLPDHWRAFEHFIIDDENNLWVSTITDSREIYKWWVMDRDGNLLAKFSWPRYRGIKKVKNGFAYTLETEEETGLQEVGKYRVQWED